MKESAIDSIIIRDSGIKSVAEIANDTGLEPEDVERRRQEIFDRIELTKHQLYMKALFQLQEIVAQQQAALKGAAPEDVARLGNTAAGAVGRSVKLVQDLEAMANKDTAERDAVYARQLVKMVDSAMNRAIGELKSRHPELDVGELSEVLEANLMEIAVEMDEE